MYLFMLKNHSMKSFVKSGVSSLNDNNLLKPNLVSNCIYGVFERFPIGVSYKIIYLSGVKPLCFKGGLG
jgi:hypothetical protein